MSASPRVYITGYDGTGESIWAAEKALDLEPAGERIKTQDLWQISKVPVPMDEDGAFIPGLLWPAKGLNFRYVIFPPQSRASSSDKPKPRAGVHETDSVDLITMVSGELYVGLEGTEREVALRPGDILIQRGTTHYWHNKSDRPAIFTVVMVDATRTAKTPRTKSGARSTAVGMQAPRPR
jgi:hypothetical protein